MSCDPALVPVSLRAATPADSAALTAIAERAYAPVLGRLPGLPDVTGGLDADIRDHLALLAEIGPPGARVPAGFVIAAEHGDATKVMNLACDPAFSGQGVARALLEAIAARARARGAARLTLVTHAGMAATLAFYRHLGWQETGRSGPAVLMQRTP